MKNEVINQLFSMQEEFAYLLEKYLIREKLKNKEFAKSAGVKKRRIKEILKSEAILDMEEMSKILAAMNKNVRLVFSDNIDSLSGLTSNSLSYDLKVAKK